MTTLRPRLTALLGATVLLLAGLPGLVGTARAVPVEDYAAYDGQRTCASSVLPGTDFLLRHLVRTNPGTRAVSTLRACAGDSTSEHKDGRALDWGVDATVPEEKAVADAWLARVLAPDQAGNPHALARRMGIMYVIWDDAIYKAYNGFAKEPYEPCTDLTACSATLRHRDHVHVSLSRAGAAAQTSFYRARKVPSVPVLYPRTNRLDPVSTAEVTLAVPANGTALATDFQVTAGETYRLVADGLVRTGPGSRVSDAACSWSGDGWRPSGTLRVNGADPWGGSCSDSHTYETTWTAPATDVLRLQVTGTTARAAEGSLTFSVLRADLGAGTVVTPRPPGSRAPRPATRAGLRARALVSEVVTVRADRARGVLTRRALRRGVSYRVVVTGTAASGTTRFDGQCVRYAGAWRPQHTLDLTDPTADHLTLYVQGVKVPLRVAGATRACDSRAHRYVGVVRAVVGGRAGVRIWDPYSYADNTGALAVTLRRR